ncbi:MAG: DUF1667 domain-containing protein [Spirochaetales bacterium]|nr:DUF1667 domain-containing protein [Spirochaetales bacterium]
MTRDFLEATCVECPRGCRLSVRRAGGEVSVSGAACPRGEAWGRRELLSPARVLTGTVRTTSSDMPRLPVRTREAIPLDKLMEAARALSSVIASGPLVPGDPVVEDFAGLGVDLLATACLPPDSLP